MRTHGVLCVCVHTAMTKQQYTAHRLMGAHGVLCVCVYKAMTKQKYTQRIGLCERMSCCLHLKTKKKQKVYNYFSSQPRLRGPRAN